MRRLGLAKVCGAAWAIALGGGAACTSENPYLVESASSTTADVSATLGGSTSTTADTTVASTTGESSASTTTEAVTSTGSTGGSGTTSGEGDSATSTSAGLELSSGTGETESGQEMADAGSSSTGYTVGEPCPEDTHRCVEPPPDGWLGPVLGWYGPRTTPLPGCPVEFPRRRYDRFAALTGTDFTCECRCNLYDPVTCGINNFVYGYDGERACRGEDFVVPGLPIESCETIDTDMVDVVDWRVDQAPTLTQGRCTPEGGAVMEEPVFNEHMRMCAPANPLGTCMDGASVCAPVPPESFPEGLCVYRNYAEAGYGPGQVGMDELACPPEYPIRREVFNASMLDFRGCSPCGCELAQGTCTGVVQFFSDYYCEDLVLTLPTPSPATCEAPTGPVVTAEWIVSDVQAACPVIGGVPQGEVELQGGFIACCSGQEPPPLGESTGGDSSSSG